MHSELIHKIFTVESTDFTGLALEVFRFQYDNNKVYRRFAEAMAVNPDNVNALASIPFAYSVF